MVLQLADFNVGDRVELSPAVGRRMAGDRHGNVVKVGRKLITARMDNSGALVSVSPDLFFIVRADGTVNYE